MTKYRIRLSTGRVLGPFDLNQLHDLKAKGHIKGREEAQIFPTGNWAPISTFDFYSELMDENKTSLDSLAANAPKEETFVIDLSKLRSQKQEKEIEELVQETPEPVIEQLTETIRITPAEQKVAVAAIAGESPSVAEEKPEPVKAEPTVSESFLLELQLDDEVPMEIESHNKTIINPIAQQEIEKMRRLQRLAQDEKDAEEAALKKADEEARALALLIQHEERPASPDESTQMMRLDRTGLMERAEEAEFDIEAELKRIKRQKEEEEAKRRSEEEAEEESENDDIEKAKKKKIVVIIAIAAVLYALLFPEEKPKKPAFVHLEPKIEFPIPFDQSDENKSAAEFKRGLEAFNVGTYAGIVNSGLSFKKSYENNLENSQALNFMVRSYAEQLKHSKNILVDAQTIFNLIQSKRAYLVQDPNGVIGLNLFYMAINKQAAAIDTVQKYLKLNPKNVTQDLFAVYLRSLVKQGKIDLAKQFYQALLKAPEKNRYTYEALIEYLLLNQESEKAMEFADEALKKNPKLALFNLLKAELLLRSQKVAPAIELLKRAEALNFDSNNLTRSKFYELKGLVSVLTNKPKDAAENFSRSLKLNDSDELRVKLSNLETSDGKLEEADSIIMESKAIKNLLQAKEFFDKKNYDLALSAAAKAVDAFPGHIPSELFLAKVQLRLGLAQQAIKTLEGLATKYPDDKTINLALVEAYIDTYKFNDAKNRIQIISTSTYKDSWEFASLYARLYLKMGDILQAMSWLRSSVSANPLNDADIFQLAQILLKKASFDGARLMLNKCMELDPVNPDYRIAYARLLYETQDDLSAIGYLLSLKEDFGENPKVMSEIAIFYHRSGKEKDFMDYKTRLEKEHSTDKALYEFLIKTALMDEKTADVPPLVEKLLAIEPGELEQMMTAGRVLFESGKILEAAKWFARVKEKMPSYPRVHYFKAKIDFLSGDTDSAMKELEEGIKANGENDEDLVLKAQIFQAKDKLVEAENLFKRAQKINAKSYDAIMGLADLSTKRNNHDLALDLYNRAMKLRQDEPMVHKKIGDVYRQLGQGALAIESYKLYLEMDPESPHKSNLEAYINLMK